MLVWWSVLFPMISIPILASVWVGFRYGPVFGLVLAAVSGLALVAWSQLWPASFQQWVTAADPEPVADLVDLPAPLDRDLQPARADRETG